ncbi:transposase [Cytophagaceae bacterium DM2B3-1]|uniref:Transposase n=1 Tax=Xanthocytophaga flava TaxID=3048013 RepID=A0ABT7CIW1_9BACT|nr:transposase [Xanthocytophaga flavus]MDJ1493668.1 transposase [Xanthocytophaga flavus]
MSVLLPDLQIKVKASTQFANTEKGFELFWTWVNKHYKHKSDASKSDASKSDASKSDASKSDASKSDASKSDAANCSPLHSVPLHFLLEATGTYHEKIAWFLYSKQEQVKQEQVKQEQVKQEQVKQAAIMQVHVILANKARAYLKSMGYKSKTDKLDAKGLAQMCAEKSLPCWKPVSKAIYHLRSLTRLHEDLQSQKTANRLQALQASMYELKQASKSLRMVLKSITAQLQSLEEQIRQVIGKDPQLAKKYSCVNSIKGIGLMTFAVIVAETDGFALIENQAQLCSYAGYDVIENQSGKRAGLGRISKKGNAHIRRVLHLPSFSVVKYEPRFTVFYQRIFERSYLKMKAYVAVQRKLLCVIYALWKKEERFQAQLTTTQLNTTQTSSTQATRVQ